MRRLLQALLLLTALLQVPAYAQNTVIEVVPLKHRTAEQVIPVLKPLVDPEGSISGFQNQLIIRAPPAGLAHLKQVLATLDTMPRRLMITVRQDADINRDQTTAEISGRVSSGNATVIIPGSGSGSVIDSRRGDDFAHGRIGNSHSVDNYRVT